MLPETNHHLLSAGARSTRAAGRGRGAKWMWTLLAVLTFAGLGLIFIPETSRAAAEKHYRAVFVAKSSLPATGKAEIQVDAKGTGHLVIQVRGLIPGQTFPAHIHQGSSIEEPGPILYPLPDLVANAAGRAALVATIPGADGLNLGDRTISVHFADGVRLAKGELN